MKTLFEKYQSEIVPRLKTELHLSNDLAVPRIKKVVVNTGIGKFLKDEKALETIDRDFTLIVGQKPSKRKAKKSIAGFKVREGVEIGLVATLRGKRMWDFLTRFISLTLPRLRDFRGINSKCIDKSGNLTIGVKEHIVFPEVSLEDLRNVFGLEVTIVTSAKNKEDVRVLFQELGIPFAKEEVRKK